MATGAETSADVRS